MSQQGLESLIYHEGPIIQLATIGEDRPYPGRLRARGLRPPVPLFRRAEGYLPAQSHAGNTWHPHVFFLLQPPHHFRVTWSADLSRIWT